MEKTATLNIRIDPAVKLQAETVLRQLGIPMATAVDMFLRQVTMTGGLPFSISLPKAPERLNADRMAPEQLRSALLSGYDDMVKGNVQDAAAAFAAFRETHP